MMVMIAMTMTLMHDHHDDGGGGDTDDDVNDQDYDDDVNDLMAMIIKVTMIVMIMMVRKMQNYLPRRMFQLKLAVGIIIFNLYSDRLNLSLTQVTLLHNVHKPNKKATIACTEVKS